MECIVPNCQVHRKRTGTTDPSIYRVPRKVITKDAWLHAIGLKNREITGMDGVCSLHFSPNDFVYSPKISRLNQYAVPSLHLSTDCASGEEEEEEKEDTNSRHEIETNQDEPNLPDQITEETTSVGSGSSEIQHEQNVQNTGEIFSSSPNSMGYVLPVQLAQLPLPQPDSFLTPCQALAPNKIVRRFVLVNCTCGDENHETYRLTLPKTDQNPAEVSKETAGLSVNEAKTKAAAGPVASENIVTTNDALGDRSESHETLSYEDEEYLLFSSSDEETERIMR